MKLTPFEQNSIKETFLKTFKTGKIYLFGSCTDDNIEVRVYEQEKIYKTLLF